jgi:hypothetical protein
LVHHGHPTDLSSFLFYSLISKRAEISWRYPYGTLLDSEADEVGLILAWSYQGLSYAPIVTIIITTPFFRPVWVHDQQAHSG